MQMIECIIVYTCGYLYIERRWALYNHFSLAANCVQYTDCARDAPIRSKVMSKFEPLHIAYVHTHTHTDTHTLTHTHTTN